jgi:hypothetical protein
VLDSKRQVDAVGRRTAEEGVLEATKSFTNVKTLVAALA